MTTIKWKFSVEDKPHEVIFKRNFVPNTEIWLDGQMVEKWREFLDKESMHKFDIDGHPAVLGIALSMSALEYFLLIDGKLVEADGKGKKPFGKAASQFVETRQRWLDMAKTKGLEYVPTSNPSRLSYTHRLIGHIHDFLAIIHAGKSKSGMENCLVSFSPSNTHPLTKRESKRSKTTQPSLKSVKIGG